MSQPPERWQPQQPNRPPQLPPPLSEDERKAWLAQQVDTHLRRGWQIESRTENVVSFRKGEEVNNVLHGVLTLLSCGLWLFIWIPALMIGGERHKTISTRDADRPTQDIIPFYQKQEFQIAAGIILVLVVLAVIGANA